MKLFKLISRYTYLSGVYKIEEGIIYKLVEYNCINSKDWHIVEFNKLDLSALFSDNMNFLLFRDYINSEVHNNRYLGVHWIIKSAELNDIQDYFFNIEREKSLGYENS